jgi:fatty acid desaturase
VATDIDDLQRELDALDPDLRPSPEELAMAPSLPRRPRHDGIALGFGLAFIVFGLVGLVRALGAPVPSAWLYPIILIGLGGAGLVSLFSRGLRR